MMDTRGLVVNEETEETSHPENDQTFTKAPENGVCFPYRYRLLVLTFFGTFNQYTLRMNFNIALVSMVNYTKEDAWNSTADSCPGSIPTSNRSYATQGGSFDWSPDIQGVLLGAFYYGYPVLMLPMGFLAEKFGPKNLFGLSILFPAVLTLLTPLTAYWNVYALVVIRILMGLVSGGTWPVLVALWRIWAPPMEQSQMVSIAGAGGTTGAVVSTAIAGVLCQSNFLGGWPSAFYVFGVVTLIWWVAWHMLVYDSPSVHPNLSQEERSYIEEGTQDLDKVKYQNPPWLSVFTSVPFLGLVLAFLAQGLGNYTLLNTTPTYMKQILKYDIEQNGVMSAMPSLASILPYALSGVFADFIRRRGILSTKWTRVLISFTGQGLMGLCFLGLAFLECDRVAAMILLSTAMAANAWTTGGLGVNVMDLAPLYAGSLFGIGNAIFNIGGFVAPQIEAAITHERASRSDWQTVFFINSGVVAFGAVIYFCLAEGEEQTWAKERRLNNAGKTGMNSAADQDRN